MGPSNDREFEPLRRVAPPPDYSSRRVQLRLLALLTLLMLVLALMNEARKPKNWQWLWLFEQPPAEQPGTDRQGVAPLDDQHGATDQRAVGDRQLESARRDAWSRLWTTLPAIQRDDLLVDLATLDAGRSLPADRRAGWHSVTDAIRRHWESYLDQAFLSVAQDETALSPEEKVRSLSILQSLRDGWSALEPTLQQVGSGEPLSTTQAGSLHAMHGELMALALLQVRDDTVFCPADLNAWFGLLSQIAHRPAGPEAETTFEPVRYVQLMAQPETYRGRPVSLRGEARLGYRVRARKNAYGFNSYYVLWIKPDDGSQAPVVVYALELPEGFPQLVDQEQDPRGTPLRAPVTVDGYFFKRWAYAAQQAPQTAPLLLARRPSWHPGPAAVDNEPGGAPAGRQWLGVFALAIALAGGLLALFWLAERRRRPHPAGRLRAVSVPAMPAATSEVLRDLAHGASHQPPQATKET